MIENKLLHFSSRQAFDEAKYNIAPSSIAFVDEGRTIYTHGVEYNALSGTGVELSQYVTYTYLLSVLNGYVRNSTITQTVQTILDAMLPSWSTIVSKIETLEGNDDDMQQAIASILAQVDGWEAQITLRALWEALSNGDKTSHVAEIFLWANEHDSGIRLSADRIDLDGVVSLLEAYIVDYIGQNPTDYSDLQTAILNLQQWRNSMGYLTNSGIVFQNNDTDNFVAFTSTTGMDPIGGLYHKHPSTGYSSYRLGNDGSGYLGLIEGSNGQHAIWWDTNGNLHFHNSITSLWGGGSGSGSVSGQFYDQAFTMTSTNVAPAVPSDANAHPWPQGANDDTRIESGYDTGSAGEGNWARSVYDPATYGIQEDSSKYVWMATRLYDIEDGTPIEESWNGPWLISGADGNPGEDGKGIEFVYTRTATNDGTVVANLTSSLQSKVANRDKTFLDEDFAPTGWYDNPSGVSSTYPYEWMGLRTSNSEGTWSDFAGPFLWSHYGQNGTDGDGVEYIFWASPDGTAPIVDPSSWSTTSTITGKNDKKFQDNDYVGPVGSPWEDNPIDLKGITYGPGSVQYVSMRKKNGATGLWGAFSAPAFWSNYAVDGIVEGYVVDLSNETMPVVVDGSGNLTSEYSSSTEVSVFHNGVKETATVTAGTPVRSDGGSVTGITAVAATSSLDSDDKTVTVTIPTTVTGIAGVSILIPLTVTLQDTTTRTVVITCFGVAAGDGKMSFNLKTDVSAIRRNIAGTVVDPSQIRVWLGTVESDGVHEYTAVNANQCPLSGTLTFEYAYDTGTYTTLSTEYIQSLQANHNQLVIRAKLNNNIIDIERIPYIKDGELGIPGTGSETYTIVPQFSSIAVNGAGKLNGTVAFNVYRQIGLGEREEITANPSYSRNVYVDVNGTNRTVSYSGGKWSTTVTNVDYDNTKTASVYIYIKTTTDTLLWSLVIPIPIKGDTGTGVAGPLKAFAFKRSEVSLTNEQPMGGNYSSPCPTSPSGWSDGIPSGTGAVWQTSTTFYADNSNTGWSTPIEISSIESTDVAYSTVESNPGTPSSKPLNWSTYSSIRNPEDIIWKAERRTTNGIVGSWEVYRIKGEKGDQGPAGATELQGFEGVVMRLSPYDSSMTYYDGTVPVDGVKYKDVVSYGTSSAGNTIYWTPNTSSVSGIIPSTQNSGSWKMFNMVNDSYIDTLISNNAYINNLTSKQVVITKREDNKDKIVAGMISGNAIPTEMQGAVADGKYSSSTNTTGVRIFAGAVPSNGNIKNTAFTVTESGTLKIAPTGSGTTTFNSGQDLITTDNAKIIFNNDGSGLIAGGNIKWDKDGNLYANKITIEQDPDVINGISSENSVLNYLQCYHVHTVGPVIYYSFIHFMGGTARAHYTTAIMKQDFSTMLTIYDALGFDFDFPFNEVNVLCSLFKTRFGLFSNLVDLSSIIGKNSVFITHPNCVDSDTSFCACRAFYESFMSTTDWGYFHPDYGMCVMNRNVSDMGILDCVIDVDILYSANTSRPASPTTSNISYNGIWSRYKVNPKWLAYRYKGADGNWTEWYIKELSTEETSTSFGFGSYDPSYVNYVTNRYLNDLVEYQQIDNPLTPVGPINGGGISAT